MPFFVAAGGTLIRFNTLEASTSSLQPHFGSHILLTAVIIEVPGLEDVPG